MVMDQAAKLRERVASMKQEVPTSRVIAVDAEKGYVQTESGTEYFVQKLLNKDEFIDYVKKTYDDERAEYYLAYANLK